MGTLAYAKKFRSHNILVHAELKRFFSFERAPLNQLEVEFEFFDPVEIELSSLDTGSEPVMMPAMNQLQVELLRSLRQWNYFIPIIAVVNDVNGYQTYLAIKSGASCVFNILVPAEKQVDALRSVLSAHRNDRRNLAGRSAERPAKAAEELEQNRAGSVDRETELLVELLCSSKTMTAIAKRFFCSERSMYRRVRQLYNDFGVSNRMELRAVVAVTD
jgi:DNA-binding NarL/FixJ family response regulator